MNTGILQARALYKVSTEGQPIDINNQLTSVSGQKQAIALLVGTPNPDPSTYEVEYYYNAGEYVEGQPSTTVNTDVCPVSNFTLSVANMVLHPGNVDDPVDIFASYGWDFVAPFPYATPTPATGGNGLTTVIVTRTATLGQGNMNFRDKTTGEIKSIFVVNTDALGWILETGTWNNLRFWEPGGIWNY